MTGFHLVKKALEELANSQTWALPPHPPATANSENTYHTTTGFIELGTIGLMELEPQKVSCVMLVDKTISATKKDEFIFATFTTPLKLFKVRGDKLKKKTVRALTQESIVKSSNLYVKTPGGIKFDTVPFFELRSDGDVTTHLLDLAINPRYYLRKQLEQNPDLNVTTHLNQAIASFCEVRSPQLANTPNRNITGQLLVEGIPFTFANDDDKNDCCTNVSTI